MVARICSDPGVMVKSTLALIPALSAWRATEAARCMSSYDELVQLPIRPAFSCVGQPFLRRASANDESGCARSGVKGPLTCGSRVERSMSMTRS